jgi:two-component system, OmpR family, sensor histidine kinase KdpD
MLASLAGVILVTWIAHSVLPVNATTVGFAYLLLVLIIASLWGFWESALASVAATLTFNFYFFPPVGMLIIADPQNRVALFSFLATALVASRLRTEAKRRAQEAIGRQEDIERLYTFSRSILLMDKSDPFANQLVRKLAEVFEFNAVVLYDRRAEEFYRAGPSDFHGLDDQLHEAALRGTSFADTNQHRTITAIRLGSEPIAALALQGRTMTDSVLQGVANLVAIGLERAHAQDLATQVEAAQRSEKLRTALLDALAHEFKTPLTSVLAATSALLNDPNQAFESRMELLRIADEEARRLEELVDDTVEMGRLDNANIRVHTEMTNIGDVVREVVSSMRTGIDNRPVDVVCDPGPPPIPVDRRLLRLAIKQLLDNALKYSPPEHPVQIHVHNGAGGVTVDVTDHGQGIPSREQRRVFERLYRSPSVEREIPGSGLGLSIALNIARAHHGDLSVTSSPGETTFRLTLPAHPEGEGT